jgi:LPPG:FO 2-phospho-L-lactate transferase
MRITVLAGGIGAARFLRGLKAAVPTAGITVIGNTGDDIRLFGLHVSPDLDTVMYTLGGGINEEQGWGRAGETRAVLPELAAYGVGPDWFGLGDRDFATHIARTALLSAGEPLSAVTRRLCERWQPGVTLLPMTDDRVETHVVLDEPGGRRTGALPGGGSGCTRPCPPRGSCWTARRRPGPRQACSRRSGTRTSCCSRRPTRWSASARSCPCRGH